MLAMGAAFRFKGNDSRDAALYYRRKTNMPKIRLQHRFVQRDLSYLPKTLNVLLRVRLSEIAGRSIFQKNWYEKAWMRENHSVSGNGS